MHRGTELFIDGQWTPPSTDAVVEVVSPHTEEVMGQAPAAAPVDVDRAVAAARAAFDDGPWPRLDPAERIANDSDYGLAGAVFTADSAHGPAIASRVRAGSFGVNEGYIMDPLAPYGGVKASGFGREFGREGLDGYLVSQSSRRLSGHDAAKEQSHRELEVTLLLFL